MLEKPQNDCSSRIQCKVNYAWASLLEDSRAKIVTVNGARYREAVNRNNENLNHKIILLFQQDASTPRIAHASAAHLRILFGNGIGILQAKVKWSPHSPDLPPLLFWGDAAKAEVYKEKPRSLRQLN